MDTDMSDLPDNVRDQHIIPTTKALNFDCLVNRIPNAAIDQDLRHHQGTINKFHLRCTSSPDIDQWILLLSNSQIQNFSLHIFWGDKHGITSPFFSFQHLTHLYLFRCMLPKECTGFRGLATLDFQEVEFVPKNFEKFIAQSKKLESLRLVDCTELDEFKIHGPTLRIFKFHGVFKTIRFVISPLLAEVSLSLPITVEDLGTRYATNFIYFEIAPSLEKLHLHPCVLEFLGAASVPTRSGGSFYCLKVLNLSMYMDYPHEVECALCLARSCPNLERLSVTLYSSGFVNDGVGQYIRDHETPKSFLDKLRRVEIALFSGTMSHIELLRYLLASTAGLEEMVISLCKDDVSVKNQIYQLPKASPTAAVSVHVWDMSTCYEIASMM